MRYLGRKAVSTLLTLLAVSFLVFLAFSVIPGDPAERLLGTEATPERVEALREEMGLDAPLPVRYFRWVADFAHGDMGTSYSYGIGVKQLIADKIPVTLALSGMAFLIMLAISLPLGIYTARHAGGYADHFFLVANQVIMAIPPFFSGILLTLLFGILLRWFTPGRFISYRQDLGAFLGYLILPALAIALPKAAMAVKLLRSSILSEADKDYVRTAYSRGNDTRGVFYHHILRNALIPVITFYGMAFTEMIVGSIIIEQVFSIPGLGRILLSSITNRDYPAVQAIIVCLAFLIIVVNFLVDLIYRKADPRVGAL